MEVFCDSKSEEKLLPKKTRNFSRAAVLHLDYGHLKHQLKLTKRQPDKSLCSVQTAHSGHECTAKRTSKRGHFSRADGICHSAEGYADFGPRKPIRPQLPSNAIASKRSSKGRHLRRTNCLYKSAEHHENRPSSPAPSCRRSCQQHAFRLLNSLPEFLQQFRRHTI